MLRLSSNSRISNNATSVGGRVLPLTILDASAIPHADGTVNAIFQQSDGKIIVGGNFDIYNTNNPISSNLIRLNSDLTYDSSFVLDSRAGLDSNSNTVYAIYQQSDGKILVGGNFVPNITSSNYLVRLNISGSLDTDFIQNANNNSGFYGTTVYSITQQADGKILVGGDIYETPSGSLITNYYISRLNISGSIDRDFNTNGGLNGNPVRTITQQSDGKILVGGLNFNSYSGSATVSRIVRLNLSGSIDTDFNQGSGFNNAVYSITQQSDGKILVGGAFTAYSGSTVNRIIRLNLSGSIDDTYNVGGGITTGSVRSIKLQTDDKVLIGGATFTSYSGSVTVSRIVRTNNSGALDTDFNQGTGLNNQVNSIEIQTNNTILLGGAFTTYSGSIEGQNDSLVPLNLSGSINSNNNTSFTWLATCRVITQQSDGKILVGGNFRRINGIPSIRIARLNPDFNLDTTFNSGTGATGTVYTITQQSDSKILVGGSFTTYSGSIVNNIVRLNLSGSIDTNFNQGSGFNGRVNRIIQQSDGKILVGGIFTSYSGSSQINKIARLNLSGSIDSDFNVGSAFDDAVESIYQQSDGKILVGGNFLQYSSSLQKSIVRLNLSGSLDTDFNTGGGAISAVYAITQQSDGKILAGGNFRIYSGSDVNNFVRLNLSGSIDTNFNQGIPRSIYNNGGLNNGVYSISQQPDGKILIGGYFTAYNINDVSLAARFNLSNNIDTTFKGNFPVFINNGLYRVQSIKQQTDGKILMSGYFINCNNTQTGGIVRLTTSSLAN